MRSSVLDKHTAQHSAAVESFLQMVVADAPLHARFLNTVSLLEHIGSRKILHSQERGGLSTEVLRHLAEETRHAMFFRRLAERVGGKPMQYAEPDLLAAPSARMYMGRLDANITRGLGASAPTQAYAYVTAAVELRALWLYGLYDEVLASSTVGISLKGVLAEEHGHLSEIGASLAACDTDWQHNMDNFTRLECQLFDTWFGQVCNAATAGRHKTSDGVFEPGAGELRVGA